MSHFDLYRRAMRQCGANLEPIDRFVTLIRSGSPVSQALATIDAPGAVRDFVGQTFAIIDSDDICAIASAFTFGREDLLPDVFRRVVDELGRERASELAIFRYYLNRHIEVDGGDHGPTAWRLLDRLCGDDPTHWRAAHRAAACSLEARIALWDTALRLVNHSSTRLQLRG